MAIEISVILIIPNLIYGSSVKLTNFYKKDKIDKIDVGNINFIKEKS